MHTYGIYGFELVFVCFIFISTRQNKLGHSYYLVEVNVISVLFTFLWNCNAFERLVLLKINMHVLAKLGRRDERVFGNFFLYRSVIGAIFTKFVIKIIINLFQKEELISYVYANLFWIVFTRILFVVGSINEN